MKKRKTLKPARPHRRPPMDERHFLAIELLSGIRDNYEEVAQTVGISRMQLYRWRKRPDFRRELRKVCDRKLREQNREIKRRFTPKTAEDIEWILRSAGIV